MKTKVRTFITFPEPVSTWQKKQREKNSDKLNINFPKTNSERCGDKIDNDFAGFDMSCDELEDLCREAWKTDDYSYPIKDWSKRMWR